MATNPRPMESNRLANDLEGFANSLEWMAKRSTKPDVVEILDAVVRAARGDRRPLDEVVGFIPAVGALKRGRGR